MNEKEILNKAIDILRGSLGFPEALIFKIEQYPIGGKRRIPDAIFLIEVGKDLKKKWDMAKEPQEESIEVKLIGKIFIAEVRLSAQPRFLRSAISYLKDIKEKFPNWNPLIVTPYIGPGARILCRKEGVSYIDILGNIGIFLKEGFIIKESKESHKREKRELKSLFSPKSSRTIRVLLENPSKQWLMLELATSTKVSLGHIHNVVKRLVADEYLEKTEKGLKLKKPAQLLDQWSSVYNVAQMNKIESFYSSEIVYERLIRKLADVAEKEKYPYAFTLFAGAVFIVPYVRTPHVHLYLQGSIEEFTQKANLKPVTSGGNVHLIKPYDEGIFNPIQIKNGIRIVGKIQLYLDLINYPARGKEQAEVLREKVIGL